MSILPDKTSPYAQPPLYGNTSPRVTADPGDEEGPPPAFSYLAGHTPDQLYGNVSPTERQSATLPPGSAHKPPSDARGEDWLPPLQTGGYAKRGLPRHTFSDVGQSNPGYAPSEYSQVGNGRHNSTGNLAPDRGSQAPGSYATAGRGQSRNSNYPSDDGHDGPERYSTAGRGQPRNSNYPSDYAPLGERQTGQYEEFTDRQTGGHYDAYPAQTTAVDIGMRDMSPTTNGPGQDGMDSMKRNRGVRPTTKQTHLGKLSSVSEDPRREPAKYGCLCIFAIVVAVVVALAAGFAAGWFLHGTGVVGGAGDATTTAAVKASMVTTTTSTLKPTTSTTTTTTTKPSTTAMVAATTASQTPDTNTPTTSPTTAKQTLAVTTETLAATTTPQTTVGDTTATTATTTP